MRGVEAEMHSGIIKSGQLMWRCMAAHVLLYLSFASPAQSVSAIVVSIQGTAPASAPGARGDALLVTGLPSLVEYPSTLIGLILDSDPVCMSFWVRSLGQATPLLRLTSAGMGGARLLDLTGKQADPNCTVNEAVATTSISLANVIDEERPVLLILPATAFPGATGGAKGKLLLLRAGMPPSEVPISVRREDYAPFVKAFLWFWGIAIPAAMAAGFGLLVYGVQKRLDSKSNERDTLEKLRRDEDGELKKFFEGIYQTTMVLEDDALYLSTMERELGATRIVFDLPRKTRERLLAALRQPDRAKLKSELAKAFPNYQVLIRKPVK